MLPATSTKKWADRKELSFGRAVRNGDVEAARAMLVEYPWLVDDVTASRVDNSTLCQLALYVVPPILLAALAQPPKKAVAMAKLLIEHGADLTVCNQDMGVLQTAMYMAVKIEFMQMLLTAKVPWSIADGSRNTPLSQAVRKGHLEYATALLDKIPVEELHGANHPLGLLTVRKATWPVVPLTILRHPKIKASGRLNEHEVATSQPDGRDDVRLDDLILLYVRHDRCEELMAMFYELGVTRVAELVFAISVRPTKLRETLAPELVELASEYRDEVIRVTETTWSKMYSESMGQSKRSRRRTTVDHIRALPEVVHERILAFLRVDVYAEAERVWRTKKVTSDDAHEYVDYE